MTPFPDDRQLDEWQSECDGLATMMGFGRSCHALRTLAAFLKSPALREALRTQEAVELRTLAKEVIRCDEGLYGSNAEYIFKMRPSLDALRTRLRASRPGLEGDDGR